MTYSPAQEAEAHARLRTILDEMRATANTVAASASIPAGDVEPGMVVRIEQGPKAGKTGEVATLFVCHRQLGTNFRNAIIDFTDGTRSVRPAAEQVTVVR